MDLWRRKKIKGEEIYFYTKRRYTSTQKEDILLREGKYIFSEKGIGGRVSVAAEDVACINLVLYIVQAFIEAVGNDGVAETLELIKIVDDLTAKE